MTMLTFSNEENRKWKHTSWLRTVVLPLEKSVFDWLIYWLIHSIIYIYLLSSVQFNCSVVSNSLWPHGLQQARPPCPSPTPGAFSNSCPSSWWCHPIISSSVVPFSSSSIRVFSSESALFTSSGQSIGVSASTSVLPVSIQDWFPLGWTCWIAWQSKRLSRVFSNTTV